MNFSFEDGKRLRSVMWNKEEVIAKKRRLLMGSVIATKLEGSKLKARNKLNFERDLYLLESYVRNNEVKSETLRTTVEGSFSCGSDTGCHRVIENYLQLFKVHDQHNNSLLKQLPNVTCMSNHCDKKQFENNIPAPRFCLTSINNMLEELDEMPTRELEAICRKFSGVSMIPKFPPDRHKGTRALLIERIKKRFQGFLLKLDVGDELPEQLSKALYVIYLSVKNRYRHISGPGSELSPFSPGTAKLHNDIIHALWLLPKVKYDQLRDLQPLLDPKAEVSIRCLRNALRTHLIECLFECDEKSAPQGLLRILDFINGRISTISKKAVEQNIEVVMILSCQLKQVISSPFSYQSDDDEQFLDDFKNDDMTDSFNLFETDSFLRTIDNEHGDSCSDNEDGVTGQGHDISSITTVNSSFLLSQAANGTSSSIPKRPDFEHDETYIKKPCVVDSLKLGLESAPQNAVNIGVKSVQKACDETALVAYELVGSMLDKLLKIEDINPGVSARSYLNGGILDPPDLRGLEDTLTSKENAPAQIFIQTVKETLPSLTKGSIRSVENLLGELPTQS